MFYVPERYKCINMYFFWYLYVIVPFRNWMFFILDFGKYLARKTTEEKPKEYLKFKKITNLHILDIFLFLHLRDII